MRICCCSQEYKQSSFAKIDKLFKPVDMPLAMHSRIRLPTGGYEAGTRAHCHSALHCARQTRLQRHRSLRPRPSGAAAVEVEEAECSQAVEAEVSTSGAALPDAVQSEPALQAHIPLFRAICVSTYLPMSHALLNTRLEGPG